MTPVQLILIASVLGAIVFFSAGAAMGALRRSAAAKAQDAPPPREQLAFFERALADAEATVQRQAQVIDEQNRLFEEEDTVGNRDARELLALRERAVRAEEVAKQQRELSEERTRQLEKVRAEAVAATTELARMKQQVEGAHAEVVAATTELASAQKQLGDAERSLADKTRAVRDLASEAEVLKGRLRDADAMRSDYVRLRTTAAEADYLKKEVSRLEQELRVVRADALGARQALRPRARGSSSLEPPTSRPIGESLTAVIERFATTSTRSVAVADRQGFPLASNGTDGVALAAYAALVIEAAGRASEFLPVGAPTMIEIVDERGVRVAVWSLEVESERLMLAHLAVSAVDATRLETTLGELGKILTPAPPAERSTT